MDDALGTWALVLFSSGLSPAYTAGAENRTWKALGLDLRALLENAYLAQSDRRAQEPRERAMAGVHSKVGLAVERAGLGLGSELGPGVILE